MMSISLWNKLWLLHSKHGKEKLVDINEAIRGEIGKNTWGKMSKIASSVQTTRRKEQLFNLVDATRMGNQQEATISCPCLQTNHRKEKLFGMFDAKHGKGIRAGFDLTWGMLSRARLVNSCSIEVDLVEWLPTHKIDKEKNVCAW